jgi:transcriptional regulator with XRE-family HTH domain
MTRGDVFTAEYAETAEPFFISACSALSAVIRASGMGYFSSSSQLATVLIMSIATIVREARRRAGLTQAELAERAGVPRSTVARIESGARTPSVELVERLVRAAGLEVTVALSEPDPGTASMFERTLRRTPAQRLADATRAARFVLRGRRELAAATDG